MKHAQDDATPKTPVASHENTARNVALLEARIASNPFDVPSLTALAQEFRAVGDESRALSLGPQILMGYFQEEHGRPLERRHPHTFTEKMYCRMLDCHESGCATFTRLADKLLVREHVAATIGARYLNQLLWHGDDIASLPWDRMPERSILKCSEGSGKLMNLSAGMDRDAVAERTQGWLADSYYWFRREFHYWAMPRRLLVEECISDWHQDGPLDYVFFCFDGVPRLIQIGSRSHTLHCFYTPDWQKLHLSYRQRYQAPDIPRPARLDEMLEVAARLSRGFDFVRIDLYEAPAGVRFGEMTFTPRAGKVPFDPPEWDVRMGEWWHYDRPDLTGPTPHIR